IGTDLLFFGLEWANAPDDHVAKVLVDPVLTDRRHWLESARRFRPHLLSEPEEKVMAEKTVTGRSAWARLFTEVTDTIEVDLDGPSARPLRDVALRHRRPVVPPQGDVARPRRAERARPLRAARARRGRGRLPGGPPDRARRVPVVLARDGRHRRRLLRRLHRR